MHYVMYHVMHYVMHHVMHCVMQVLFEGTVAQNISYGKEGATQVVA